MEEIGKLGNAIQFSFTLGEYVSFTVTWRENRHRKLQPAFTWERKDEVEIKSYNETVRELGMQMSADNQQLVWFKREATKNKMKSKAHEETLTLVSEKHRLKMREIKLIRLKMKMHNEQRKEEKFFKDQVKMFPNAWTAEDDKPEKILWGHGEISQQPFANASSPIEDYQVRVEKDTNFIKPEDKDMGQFVEEKGNLIIVHEERKRKLLEEAVALQKRLDLELAMLVEKYSPKQPEQV